MLGIVVYLVICCLILVIISFLHYLHFGGKETAILLGALFGVGVFLTTLQLVLRWLFE